MKILFLAAALAAAGLANAASAEPATVRTTVSTVGLDLSTPEGMRALDLRILHAASAFCGTPSPADPQARASHSTCRNEFRASAEAGRARAIASAKGDLRLASAAAR